MDSLGKTVWKIRSCECGENGNAKLCSILNLLQEAASLHASQLGFSKSDFAARGENISWVLTRLKTRIWRYPRWDEEISIVTWPRAGRKITALRDFELHGADGESIGIATSEWMVLDLAARRAVPVPQKVFELANDVRAPVFGDETFARLKWTEPPPDAARASLRLRANRDDIDLNGHVNNVHYVEWFLETLPEDAAECGECDVVFKSETFAGESVLAESVETAPGEFIHRVCAADGREHVLAKTTRTPNRQDLQDCRDCENPVNPANPV